MKTLPNIPLINGFSNYMTLNSKTVYDKKKIKTISYLLSLCKLPFDNTVNNVLPNRYGKNITSQNHKAFIFIMKIRHRYHQVLVESYGFKPLNQQNISTNNYNCNKKKPQYLSSPYRFYMKKHRMKCCI